MASTTTRASRKRAEHEAFAEAQAQKDEMLARIEQIAASHAAAEEKRASFEAELRQAVTEIRFELRTLQEKHSRASKQLQERCLQLDVKSMAVTTTIDAFQRSIERLLDRVGPSSLSDAARRVDGARYDEQQDVQPAHQRSGIMLAAEDRLSEMDDMRSEASVASTTPTGYCHSSLDSARRALAASRSSTV